MFKNAAQLTKAFKSSTSLPFKKNVPLLSLPTRSFSPWEVVDSKKDTFKVSSIFLSHYGPPLCQKGFRLGSARDRCAQDQAP